MPAEYTFRRYLHQFERKDGKKMKTEWKKYIKAGTTVFVLFLLMYYWARIEQFGSIILYSLTPLFGGFLIAYIINIPMSFFERVIFPEKKIKPWMLKIKRPVCIVLSVLALLALIFLVTTLIVPELVLCVELIADELPPIIEGVYENLDNKYGISETFKDKIADSLGGSINWESAVEKAIDFVINGLGGAIGSVFTVISSVFSTIFLSFVSMVFALYLLAGKEKLCKQLNILMQTCVNARVNKALYNVSSVANQSFRMFIVGQCMEAVILGVLCMIGMLIFRFPYATMIGTLVGFTALIPVAGAYIGAAIGAFMVFTSDSFIKAVLFIVFIVVLQQIEGNLIYPKVVGASIGLPGIWVLAAITVGGAFFGIPGMLISVPVFATAYKLIRSGVAAKKEKMEVRENLDSQENLDSVAIGEALKGLEETQ